MYKRILACFMVVLLSVSAFSYSVQAAGTPTITVSSAQANAGDTVTLDVSISNNLGINTFSLGFNYDTARLSLSSVEATSGLGGQFTYSKKAVWLNSTDTTYNGKILTLTFKVLDNAAAGDASVAVTYNTGDISNYNEDDVNFTLVAGKVTVKASGSQTTQGTISVSSAQANAGDNVTLDVSISNNPGINTFSLGFNYDTSRLNLVNVEAAVGLGGQFSYSKKAVWLNSTDTTYNGKILTLTFKVLDNAAAGDASVAVTYNTGDISNYNEDDVNFTLAAGKVTVAASGSQTNQGKISVSTAQGKAGDTVTLDVSISNNPGINTFSLGFNYDTSRLNLVNVEAATGLGGQFTYSQKAVWLNSSDTTYNGKILTLTFKVLDNAATGDASVAVTYNAGDISNYNEDDVNFTLVAGKVKVTDKDVSPYSLTASPASPQKIGTPITLTATGGSSYRFYYEQNGKWVNIRNYSSESSCVWTPTVPRRYTIYVDIKDETGKVVTCRRIEYTVTDAYTFTLDKEGEQNVGVNMTLTAKGGSSYKFYYEYNGAWCNITSNTTGVCEWSPKYAGNYMLYVDIKDASGKVIACRTQAFKLNDPFSLFSDAQTTELPYGNTINFSANGGTSYKFYYEKQGEWQRVQDFSSKNTCAWTPTEAGKYNFYCDIKDASGAVVSCKRMTFNITNPYSFTADKATTQSVGTKITFTATGGYQYKFYYEKDGSWVRIQSFTTANTCAWTPTVAGRYNVYCDIADENGTVLAYKGMEFVIGSVSADSYTFTTSVESPKPMNTAVTLTATGGSSYKFYYEVGGKWATIKNFSTANTATWTPDMIADYTLYVDIKNSSGKVVKTLSKKFSATDPYSFTADMTSPQNIGKSVKFTAAGGASYKFYYQYAGAWVKIQDSTSATCNWKPNKAGEYMVYVDIKNASGAVVTCRTMKLVFNDPYRFTSSASSLTQPAGTAISLSANGGASYKFYYEKDGAWVRIQDYSTTKTCTWTPTETGKYNVFCDIKDASGSVAVCKRITFTITEKCTITASKTNASVGDTITFTATGGSSYKFYYEKDGAWVRIQSFSTSNTCNWKPTAAGDYVVYVDVNDANGNLIGCKGVRCVVG